MIELFIGIIFITVAAVTLCVTCTIEFSFTILPVVLLFGGVGVVLFKNGLKEIIRNTKTAKYGEECFGKIVNHYDTGIRVNENPIYGAKVLVYINSENRTIFVEEKIGYDRNLYKKGSYVKVKYYEEDINFICEVPENSVPLSIKETIEKNTTNYLQDIKSEFDDFENQANRYEAFGSQTTAYASPEAQAKASKAVGIFFIIFATIWLLMSIAFFGVFNFIRELPADHYYLNGEEVTREEFEEAEMFPTTEFFTVIFVIVGVTIFIIGIKLVLTKPAKEDNVQKNNNYKKDFATNDYEKIYETNSSDEDDPIKNL